MKTFLKYFLFGSLLALIQTNFIKAQINNEGIVCYYPFNGNANDESGNSINGNVIGASLTTDRFGNENRAYYFDGINDYIVTNSSESLDLNSYSLIVWFYNSEPASKTQCIVAHGESIDTDKLQYGLFLNIIEQKSIQSWYELDNDDDIFLFANTRFEDNLWYCVAITRDNEGKQNIYVNGESENSIVNSNSPPSMIYPLYIGAKTSPLLKYFHKGKIDDIRVYNHPLSSNEIKSLYLENINTPPVSNAGEDQTIECDGTEVTLDGSGSSDPDEDELTYTWYSGEDIVSGSSDEPTTTLNLQLGTYTFALEVNDGTETSTDEVVIVIEDTTPPTLTANEQYKIWPVNHKYVKLDVDDMISSLNDGCSGELQIENVVITKVTSDEPEDDPSDGDGSTLDDMVIYDGCSSVGLRAERLGESNGRVYTVTLSIADASGNIGSVDFEAYVPHNVKDLATKDEVAHFVDGACEATIPSEQLAISTFENNNSITVVDAVPSDYIMSQNYPNPFNPKTNIHFSIPHSNHVSLRIYDQLGKEIAILVDQTKSAGSYTYEFDGSNLSSGIYVYRLQAGEFIDTKKLVLMK